ncbi:MAG: helix-turn-helix domain-containing protein [Pelagimonas sp.]|jgi:transcriptional regulator with XRE-family HTH domain|nr:helix-turn-helix domain-containing protein [Pelagimonas sp.]
MTSVQIDADRLKTLRKARKLGRPKLAKLAGLTERQITRLESGAEAKGALPDATLARLALVLQVPEEALSGVLPLSEADLGPIPASTGSSCSCCS